MIIVRVGKINRKGDFVARGESQIYQSQKKIFEYLQERKLEPKMKESQFYSNISAGNIIQIAVANHEYMRISKN